MTRLGVFSDLHLDNWGWKTDAYLEVDAYLNAGDTTSLDNHRATVAKLFPGVHVMGNHDYYGGYFPEPGDGQFTAYVGDLKVVGCTLWTPMKDEDWPLYVHGMQDAKSISKMSPAAMRECHEADLEFIRSSDADVVVTHHAPSFKSIAKKYEGNSLNKFFACRLDENGVRTPSFINSLKKKPLLWVHGHVHGDFDYLIGETRVVCRPRGYPHENRNEYAATVIDVRKKVAESVDTAAKTKIDTKAPAVKPAGATEDKQTTAD